MQIYVNDQELDAKLVEENNLLDVYESINDWTSKNTKYILGFLVDQTEYSIRQLKDLNPDDVKRIDFFIGDEVEMMISTVDELDRYIDQIGSVLYEEEIQKNEDYKNLNEGIHWIMEIMKSVSGILKIDLNVAASPVSEKGDIPIDIILNNLDTLSLNLIHEENTPLKDEFLSYLRGLKFFVMKLGFQIRMMNADFDELMDSVDEFENRIDELSENMISINIAFSSGNDGEALNTLDSATEKLNHYLSVLYALDYKYLTDTGTSLFKIQPSGDGLLKHAREITEHLKNLSDMLEKKDIVSAGDILEYEITESLKNLKPYLIGIKEFLLARK